MLHYRAVSRTTWQRVLDVLLGIFGLAVMIYTTALTVSSWVHGSEAKPPGYCDEN